MIDFSIVSPEVLRRTRVLVADDEQAVVVLVGRILQQELGCRTEGVASGDEAIARLKEEAFDILLTDMVMPGLHGLELLQAVHTQWPAMAIVAMTGFAPEFPYLKVLQAGAVDFINKPFPALELTAKMARIVRERETLRELRNAEYRYRSLFDLSSDGMMLLDPRSYAVSDVNHAFKEMVAAPETGCLGLPLTDLFPEADRFRLQQWLPLCVQKGGGSISDVSLTDAQGGQRYVELTATVIPGEADPLLFLIAKDVTDRREQERLIADSAHRDELTGLLNKRSFESRLAWAAKQATLTDTPLSLIMLDLDNFKACNDTYGHPAGDKLLAQTGMIIRDALRRSHSDSGFRFGGDEFAILLQNTPVNGSQCVAQRIQEAFSRIERRGTTISIGVAEYLPGAPAGDFLKQADQALYDAKSQGKNTIAVA